MAHTNMETILTASDRIKQLNEIDREVIKLLQSAGLAVKALTMSPSSYADQSSSYSAVIKEQRMRFIAATSEYFALLSSIDVRLRRQIYALEEVGIPSTESLSKQLEGRLATDLASTGLANVPNLPKMNQAGISKGATTGGGLGNLDVGWLNSRNDNVGKEMEAEMWEKAQHLVEMFKLKDRQERDRLIHPEINSTLNS